MTAGRWLIGIAIVLSGCSDQISAPSSIRPMAPDSNDPAFTVGAVHRWYLVGDALTPGDDQMTILVAAPGGTASVDAYVADLTPVRLTVQDDGQFGAAIAIGTLPPGDHDLLLSADDSGTAFARIQFHRSAPYYVMVSTDWDFSDPGKASLDYQDALHHDHPGMKVTQFIGPYTFTDPAVTPARATELATWIANENASYGDEIGLHIHPYCNFVTDAGLACITDQSTVYTSDTTGYTIKVAAYGHHDFGTLLDHAKEIFAQHGLGTPNLFRAGGWTADLSTFEALVDTGFVADSSALNWARIEEWKGKELYTWTRDHWGPIDDTSQPYLPTADDVLPGGTGAAMQLLEVPDNGVMIDYVSLAEMTGIFDANFNGTPLARPTTLMMGFHPSSTLSRDEYLRVDGLLKHADKFLAKDDNGPVIYTTMGKLVGVF